MPLSQDSDWVLLLPWGGWRGHSLWVVSHPEWMGNIHSPAYPQNPQGRAQSWRCIVPQRIIPAQGLLSPPSPLGKLPPFPKYMNPIGPCTSFPHESPAAEQHLSFPAAPLPLWLCLGDKEVTGSGWFGMATVRMAQPGLEPGSPRVQGPPHSTGVLLENRW